MTEEVKGNSGARGGHLSQTTIAELEARAAKARYHPDGLAALCGISLRTLERHFAARIGKTVETWCREVRCRQARAKIEEGWSGKAVFQEFHFADASHMAREFRFFYGQPPRAFVPVCVLA